jgi:glyoxylase-like metal-dependent hydrolase (beta-lactamase superfamily II)/8-oxo-dGTP pyrophosphatase MutT (NUDIX family)
MESINRSEEADAEPRPAATLVLLRDRSEGPEVLLTQRLENLRFMGGAIVFPGGAVADADLDPEWERASARSRREAAAALSEPDEGAALASFVAAVRETFEEVGVLLATGPKEGIYRADARDPRHFLDRCLDLGVVLATDRLAPTGRWVTPLGAPIRFDARFFLARAPEGVEPSPDPREVARCYWSTPEHALAELSRGDAVMAPPTIEMLQRLQEHSSADEAMEALTREGVGEPQVLSVRVSPLVQVVLAPNPSLMTGPGTNTYVVGGGPNFVIDPAADDDRYMETVERAARDVEAILVTHRHPDHTGGVALLAERTGAAVRAWGEEDVGGVRPRPLHDGELLEAGGARLRVLHTPGHASDHVCFLLEGAASLFAGDNVLGEGTAVIGPPDGNMRDYLATLHMLSGLRIDRIYPGHFRPLDGGTKVIEGYIAHRAEREAAILQALTRGPLSVEQIVAEVYADVPEILHPVAAQQVLAHLELLADDGRALQEEGGWKPTES